jgi:hypothetical protein
MLTAIAVSVQTLALLGTIDRPLPNILRNREVPSCVATDTVPLGREAVDRSRPSFLTALLRSFAVCAA